MIYLTLLAVFCVSLTSCTPFDNRIINGVDAPSTPWVAYIKIYVGTNFFACTGSLVASDWILTAKHCVDYENPSAVVFIGDVNRLHGEEIQVSLIERYNMSLGISNSGDVALLKLATKVKGIRPINVLYDDSIHLDGRLAFVYGWGLTIPASSGPTPDILQTTVVRIDSDYCTQEDQLCFTPYLYGSNVCHGDSGGPMIVYDNNEFILVGVLKGGSDETEIDCTGEASYYLKTSYYGDWIQSTINRG